jgi:hypothetical protein
MYESHTTAKSIRLLKTGDLFTQQLEGYQKNQISKMGEKKQNTDERKRSNS